MFTAITLIEYKVLKETSEAFTDYHPTKQDALAAVALTLCPVLNAVIALMLLSVLSEQIYAIGRLRK